MMAAKTTRPSSRLAAEEIAPELSTEELVKGMKEAEEEEEEEKRGTERDAINGCVHLRVIPYADERSSRLQQMWVIAP